MPRARRPAGCARATAPSATRAAPGRAPTETFHFVQLSDPHWGFNNPAINPDFAGTLKKAIAGVNALPTKPDFIVFTGDLTQTTDDDKVRRARMKEFREIIKGLDVPGTGGAPRIGRGQGRNAPRGDASDTRS